MKRLAGTALVAAALLALPLATQSDFVLTILVFAFLQGMLAVSFNLVFGYAGQLSMFHAAAFGIAAYATHLFGKHLGVGYWGGVVLAAALVAAISVVVGAICFRFRLREFYFAVVTLAFSEMARLTVLNWNSMTNGSLGINLQERPIESTLAWYYVALGALGITLVACWRLVHSWMGRAFAAIRLNDELGDTLGINVFRYKLIAFTAGSIMAAFAGSLYAYFLGSLEPGLLSIDTSLGIIAMVLLGGRNAVAAPVVGALVLTALPHLIHFSAEIRSLVYGAILIFSILVMPQGIYGAAAQLIRRHA